MSLDSVAIATGIVRASQSQECVDSSPLEENDVGMYILESNGHPSVPEDWRLSVKGWPIRYVIYYRIGLFFQLQKYNHLNSDRNMTRMCLRQYNSTRRRHIMSQAMRLERKILGFHPIYCKCPLLLNEMYPTFFAGGSEGFANRDVVPLIMLFGIISP